MKICTKCKTEKPIEDFPIDKATKSGRRSSCKKCLYISVRQCAAKDPAKYKERARRYHKKWYEKNADAMKAQAKKWHDSHPESHRKSCRAYQKRYPHKSAARTAQYQAAKKSASPPWLTDLHLSQIEIFYDAAEKLTKELGIPFQVDHIIPLRGRQVSGLHVPWNLQVLPGSENVRKGNKLTERTYHGRETRTS